MIRKFKLYARLIFGILFFSLIIALIISVKSCKSEKENNVRLKNNQESYFDDLISYRDKYGKSVAEVKAITLRSNEFKKLCVSQQKEIKELNIDIKRLKSYSRSATITDIPINTVLHDSVFIINNKVDTLRCLNYRDNYFSIDGCINNDTLIGKVNTIDTLIQTVSIIPKHFLFFKWGVKGIKQTIKSKNPYTTIISSEYIRIE